MVDAAVAVSFALGVVEPDASGIGGYGQMLIYKPGMDDPKLIEFMTRAPEEASLLVGGYLENGEYPPDGPVLANVPGTVAAMYLAWQKHGSGTMEWADLLAPAIRAAENGYEVSDGLATTLSVERDHYLKYDGPKTLFFRNGEPLGAGDTVVNTDLAWTLRQIAEGGADAFYEGEVGRRLVADLRGQGNAMRMTDLERYYAAEREPVSTTYKGIEVYNNKLILYGAGDFLNDYEGIRGHEEYRDDLTLMYFPNLDPESGELIELRLVPMHIRNFRLNRPSRSDAKWLQVILDRECRKLGTRVDLGEDGKMSLRW